MLNFDKKKILIFVGKFVLGKVTCPKEKNTFSELSRYVGHLLKSIPSRHSFHSRALCPGELLTCIFIFL